MAKRWGTLAVMCVLAASTTALADSGRGRVRAPIGGLAAGVGALCEPGRAVPAATGIVFRVRLHTHGRRRTRRVRDCSSTPGSPDRGHYLTPAALGRASVPATTRRR